MLEIFPKNISGVHVNFIDYGPQNEGELKNLNSYESKGLKIILLIIYTLGY